MEDRLPNIPVKRDVPPADFLRRMAALVNHASFKPEIREHIPGSKSMTALNLEPTGTTAHEGLVGHLIVDTDSPGFTRLEVTASRWAPDPPTYQTYVQAARDIFDPLLRQYNRQHGVRVHMAIQTMVQLGPKLPAKAQQVFARFVGCANKRALHPRDWHRFYDFIWHCHGRRLKLGDDDVKRLLVTAGFRKDKARYIADVYEHGRELLRSRYAWRYELRRAIAAEAQADGEGI